MLSDGDCRSYGMQKYKMVMKVSALNGRLSETVLAIMRRQRLETRKQMNKTKHKEGEREEERSRD